jgi:hypothetical protein
MSPVSIPKRSFLVGMCIAAAGAGAPVALADTPPANGEIVLEELTFVHVDTLPLGILRGVARDRASRGERLTCPDLRRCDELSLQGVSVDLDGDGSNEWFVTDLGFTGTGAELDYIFRKDANSRWKTIGRIEGLHLTTVGPAKTSGFLDIHGYVVGVCVEGPGKATWDGHQYGGHSGPTKARPC